MSPFRTAVLVLLAAAGPATAQAGEYPLAVPPLAVIDRLAKAEVGPLPALSADDRAFLEAVWAARSRPPADRKPPAAGDTLRACLLAGGVTDPAARAAYGRKFEAVVAAAEKAVAAAKTPRDKADKLLRLLHAGPMAKGYDADQSTLPGVFDTGKFNCVSSAALYHLVGGRLGLDLEVLLIPGAVGTPGHATLDLVDAGKRVQVEPTNPDGFDWATKLAEPGVVVLGVEPDRKKAYRADALGLAASTASNRGTAAAKADPPRPAEAAHWAAVALALHPGNKTAAHNLTAALSNWGLALAKADEFEGSLRVFAVGAAVSPKDQDIVLNHTFAWSRFVEAELAAGRDAAALKVLARAAAVVPTERGFRNPAEWLAASAEKARKAGGWEAGLAAAARGLKLLPANKADDLRDWRSAAYRRWSQERLAAGDYDGSLKVLVAGRADGAGDRDLRDGAAYHTQEALKGLAEAKAAAHFRAVRAAFPDDKGVREAGAAHARRGVAGLASAGKFAEAVKRAAASEPLAGEEQPDVLAGAYDAWAEHLAGAREWEAAVVKYAEGLKVVPADARLTNNVAFAVQEWAKPAVAKEDWAEAARRYEVGLKHVPGHKGLAERLAEYRKRAAKPPRRGRPLS